MVAADCTPDPLRAAWRCKDRKQNERCMSRVKANSESIRHPSTRYTQVTEMALAYITGLLLQLQMFGPFCHVKLFAVCASAYDFNCVVCYPRRGPLTQVDKSTDARYKWSCHGTDRDHDSSLGMQGSDSSGMVLESIDGEGGVVLTGRYGPVVEANRIRMRTMVS